MKRAIWAIYFHKLSTEDNPQHALCPLGEDSWCGYNRSIVTGEFYIHKHSLPESILLKKKKVFRDLTEKNLLKKCLHGRTQNPNESFNKCVWERIPKTVFVGIETLKFGVMDAVICFNDGYVSRTKVFEALGIKPGYNTERALLIIDNKRIFEAERIVNKVSLEARNKREDLEQDEKVPACSYPRKLPIQPDSGRKFETPFEKSVPRPMTVNIQARGEPTHYRFFYDVVNRKRIACGLSYRSIVVRVGRDPITVSRIWNRWVQDGNTERCAGSQRSYITSSQEARHVTRMTLMDRAATSRALSLEWETFTRQQVSARTVRRRFQQHVLSSRRPWLKLHHRQDRLQRVINDESGRTNCKTSFFRRIQVLFTASRYRVRVWRYRGERTFAACIRHRYTGSSYGGMIWGTIVYTLQSRFVRTDSTLNSARYISGVLRALSLPFIQALRNLMFKQDNTWPHVAGILQTFLDTKNVWLLPWPSHSLDLSPIENVWSMVAERLALDHTPVTTFDELWYRVEAVWVSVPLHAI
ncbi:uncharacterized protein TNCV_3121911 [Trichonephila clavipes]|nr:uncharacterized protein TNCV_3121911 [Trichonephila clavipes]